MKALVAVAVAVEAAFLGGEKLRPLVPFYKDADGYYVERQTLPVFDGRMRTEAGEGSSATSDTAGSATASSATASSLFGYEALRRFESEGGGRGLRFAFDASEERALARREMARGPVRGIEGSGEAVIGGPLNPMYRDRTNASSWVSEEWSSKVDGWLVSGRLRSRSKRCKSFVCPVERVGGLSGLEACIAASAPGCVLEFEATLDLLEQGALCCFDSAAKPGAEGVPDWQGAADRYQTSNYTWFLPTPALALDLALRGNVSTFARFRRPRQTGLFAARFLSAGFAVTKMNGACADYKWFDIARHAAKLANPTACLDAATDDYEYVDCHGWPAPADTADTWNHTNARQLVFTAVLDDTNCLTAASQYALLTARLTLGAIIHPPPGAAADQRRAPLSAALRAAPGAALEYGYPEHPPPDASY